ncbi:MAG: signal peptidase II, partial [Chloroflexi bacterium]|nr:signal peptidase II [Chloroflexota bacterium]
VLGGAIGNLTDRLLRGRVVDFVDVQLWPGYHWPAFNVADSALLIGLVLLGLYVMRRPRPGERRPAAPARDAEVSTANPPSALPGPPVSLP